MIANYFLSSFRTAFFVIAFVFLSTTQLSAQLRPTYTLEFSKAVFKKVNDDGTITPQPSLAPSGSQFQILDENETSGELRIKFTRIPETPAQQVLSNFHFGSVARSDTILTEFQLQQLPRVEKGIEYQVKRIDLPRYTYHLERGPNAGILALPYKLQTKDGNITAGGTLGLFLGYHQRWFYFPSTIGFGFIK